MSDPSLSLLGHKGSIYIFYSYLSDTDIPRISMFSDTLFDSAYFISVIVVLSMVVL